MAGKLKPSSWKQKYLDLEEQNRMLRARLDLTEPLSEDDWGTSAPQDLRDQMASRALIQCWLREREALKLLGFDPYNMKPGEWKPLAKRIFDTPGVRAILERNMEDFEAHRGMVIARQIQIAEHGNDEASVRAATVVGKLAGWSAPDQTGPTVHVTLQQLIGQVGKATEALPTTAVVESDVIDADAFLLHEPGGATAIGSDE